MADTVASYSSAASPNKFYHVFISHRGPDVKKTFASHLYRRLCSAHIGLEVFLDQQELRVGRNFDSQIIDAIRTACVHVAIFSPRYAESPWCLDELLYMLESKATIIPVFYHVDPAALRWTQSGSGVYAEALRILENKKKRDPQTDEEMPRHHPDTIKKWRDALNEVAMTSGFNLHEFNGDEGALLEKIVERVLEEIKSTPEFYRSPVYGGPGGGYIDDGTYSGIRQITLTVDDKSLTSVQMYYGLEGNENLIDRIFQGRFRGRKVGEVIKYNLNYPEEFVTKISGYFGRYKQHDVLISLTFHTNQRKLGPCGAEVGPYFESEVKGKIVGIFGSSGVRVDSIGMYMRKARTPKHEEFYCSPLCGGPGGNYTSDGTYSGIRQITLTVDDKSLTSVQMSYGLEGIENLIKGHFHGRKVGEVIKYNLNYPEEFVTKISGYLGYKHHSVVISLTFHTNQRKLGPCGQEEGTYFETQTQMRGKIVGVFGSSGDRVDSIGMYMRKLRTSKYE